jgi:hypothetical protein
MLYSFRVSRRGETRNFPCEKQNETLKPFDFVGWADALWIRAAF